MATEIIMPKAGMVMEEGTIIKWLLKKGDFIEKGEPLLEIMTDKVNMEVEAPASGILLEVLAQEGEVLPVTTIIGYIGKEGEDSPAVQSSPTPLTRIGDYGKVRATPASRKMARDNNIDIYKITGSGPMGRIQKSDIVNYKATPLATKIAIDKGLEISAIKGTGIGGKIIKSDIISRDKERKIKPTGEVIPLTGMRRAISDSMTKSFYTAPTFTLNIEVDMTKGKDFKNQCQEIISEKAGKRLTYTDIIVFAVAKALKEHPRVNASWVEEGILLHNNIHIGLAVGLDDGLVVPVIKDVDQRTVSEIAMETKDLAARALSKELTLDEMQGSTFTISNLGMYGISHFNPIINQPNSAILGVNTIIDKMRVVEGEPQVRPIMTLSLTIDHRVIDGAPAAKFLQYLKKIIENPLVMLL